VHIERVRSDDVAAVLALNQAEVPRLGPLRDADHLTELLSRCHLALVARETDLLGFVLAIAPGSDYASVNYRWFEARGTDHLYVDRLAVAREARRQGVASALYDAVEEQARADRRAEVTCEVNVRPRNEASLAFHHARGFEEVGRQDTSGGALTVAMLAKAL
jgi:predicted GNAT superfamily acetyltransferase